MATDSTLAQGAFQAAADYRAPVYEAQGKIGEQAAQGLIDAKKSIDQRKALEEAQAQKDLTQAQKEAARVAKEEEVRLKQIDSDWEKSASKVLESDGVTAGNHDAMFDNVSSLKQEYMNALNEVPPNKKKASKIMTDLKTMGEGLDLFKETQIEIANDKKGNQFSNAVSEENRQWYSSLQNGNIQPSYNEDGELGVVGPDGESFVAISNINDILEGDRVDVDSKNALTDLRQGLYEAGRDGEHTASFDEESVKQSVQTIIENGNMRSIFNDPMFGTTSMATDLLEEGELNNISYGDLGFTAEQIVKLDKGDKPNGVIGPEDKLTVEDKKEIIKMLSESSDSNIEKIRNDKVAQYFLENARANWRRGVERSIKEHNRKNPNNLYIAPWQKNTEVNNTEVNMSYSGK
jgi:hypothetical protein